jgi:hypothetical protein
MPEGRVKATVPWLVQHLVNPLMLLTGGVPTLTIVGRRTGKRHRVPINVVELNGARYLTSPRGETGWSRNLRRTGECWLKMKGAETHYRATEVPPEERAPIIGAYLERWRAQTQTDWQRLPDPLDHPTFKLEAIA